MLKQGNDYAREREKALADGLRDVASASFDMVEPTDFITYIKTEQFGNLRNLVNSSTGDVLQAGHRSVSACPGEVDLEWVTSPCISLDMEFHHMGVSAYFRLVLWSLPGGCRDDLRFLQEQLARARREHAASRERHCGCATCAGET